MTKTEIYNEDYTKLNHAYIQIFDSYKKLLDAHDADAEVVAVLAQILTVLNPVLDRIKSEMTVKTRYKDAPPQGAPAARETAPVEKSAETETKNGGKIFHPKFGD